MSKYNYNEFLIPEYMMGPNSLRLLEELLEHIPEKLTGNVLDLGCGRAISSLYLARETAADTVFAADLWISPSENHQRIKGWGEHRRIVPLRADAHDLPFADGYFSAIVSLDAYHYFGCGEGFFAHKILPLLEQGGYALIAMPGVREEFGDAIPPLMQEWAEEDARFFHSAAWWKEHISKNGTGADITVRESAHFDAVWQDWLDSGHEYAARDREYLEQGLRDMLCFVLIVVRKI